MRIATMMLAASLATAGCTASQAGSQASARLGESVPWEAPPERRRSVAAPSLARARPEVVAHGVQVVDRGGGEVEVLAMLEIHNPSGGAIEVPAVEIVAELASAEGREGCAPAEPLVGAREPLEPGERRLMWAQMVCPVGDAPGVVRVTARTPDGTTELGEVLVVDATPPSATASR